MNLLQERNDQQSVGARLLSVLGRILLAVSIPLIAFYVLYQGFLFLRDSDAPAGVAQENKALIKNCKLSFGSFPKIIPAAIK